MADHALVLAGVLIAFLAGMAGLALLVLMTVRALHRRERQAAESGIIELTRLQTEAATRIEAMRDMLAGRQAELHRAVNERLDSVTHHSISP